MPERRAIQTLDYKASEPVDLADPRPHLPALDGVRGMAVLLVVASHAMRIVPRTGGIDHAGWQAMAAGWVGVDLFFALSGFLITGILYDAKPKGTAGSFFLNFYARRTLRIAPLYYGFLLFYFFLLPRMPIPDADKFVVEPEVRPMFWFYLYNFWGAIHQRMHGNLGVFWSLCVEEHFYLVWPFVVWFLGRRQLMRVCVTLGVLSLAARALVIKFFPNDHAAYLMTPCRLDGLAAGAFVALAMRDPADWKRIVTWAPRVALAAVMFILGMAMGQRHLLDNIDFKGRDMPGVDSSVLLCVGLTALALLFGSLVAMVVNVSGNDKSSLSIVFRNAFLRSLGKYSYAIYVFHPLVISLTRRAIAAADFQFPQAPAAALAARVAVIPVILAITCAAAFVSYHLYEKHFLALKRFFPPAKRPLPVSAAEIPAARDDQERPPTGATPTGA